MEFQKDKVNDFKTFSLKIKPIIRSQEGCMYLDILQDTLKEDVFFTISHWKTESDLQNYRQSTFFNDVWHKAKGWFSEKPEAWSLNSTDKENLYE